MRKNDKRNVRINDDLSFSVFAYESLFKLGMHSTHGYYSYIALHKFKKCIIFKSSEAHGVQLTNVKEIENEYSQVIQKLARLPQDSK